MTPLLYFDIRGGAAFTGIATLTSFMLMSAVAHSEVLPAPRSQYLPAVAANGELYLVVWADERESRQNESDIFGARVTADGRVLDPNGIRICSLSGIQSYPAVASDGRDFLVVWQDDRDERSTESDIYGARVTVQGVVLDPNGFRISGAIHPQYAPSVAFNGRHYLVAWLGFSLALALLLSLRASSFGLRLPEFLGGRLRIRL